MNYGYTHAGSCCSINLTHESVVRDTAKAITDDETHYHRIIDAKDRKDVVLLEHAMKEADAERISKINNPSIGVGTGPTLQLQLDRCQTQRIRGKRTGILIAMIL